MKEIQHISLLGVWIWSARILIFISLLTVDTLDRFYGGLFSSVAHSLLSRSESGSSSIDLVADSRSVAAFIDIILYISAI